ncbi:uncharacterized protein L203_101715 [Cryptococcus depauperatus CBS 7841]|uniref:Topoisomerase I damage affected protein 2 n=1 Tax=Cryptococcus depauperatus CBS 7841 TaxID=1295531 RepID=A0AAJ8M012_9TREE
MSSTSRINGALSPPLARAGTADSKPRFPSDILRTFIKELLLNTLSTISWEPEGNKRMRELSKGIAEKIKGRMVEIEPNGFKYVVTATLTENKGQAARGDLVCHWEDCDQAIQEVFNNESIIYVVTAYALRCML